MKKTLLAVSLALAAMSVFAQDVFVPNDVPAPSALLDVVNWFLGNKVVQIGTLTSVLVSIISLLKALAPVVGAKLKGKSAYILTSAVSLITAVGLAIEDGVLSGSEWSALIVALFVVVLAPFGYRVVFSQTAKSEGAVVAAGTMFIKK